MSAALCAAFCLRCPRGSEAGEGKRPNHRFQGLKADVLPFASEGGRGFGSVFRHQLPISHRLMTPPKPSTRAGFGAVCCLKSSHAVARHTINHDGIAVVSRQSALPIPSIRVSATCPRLPTQRFATPSRANNPHKISDGVGPYLLVNATGQHWGGRHDPAGPQFRAQAPIAVSRDANR